MVPIECFTMMVSVPASEERVGPREATWVVMGGGAVKGLAHVGVWRAILEARISVAGIIGTSVGAMIGAAIAGGRGINLRDWTHR